MSIKRFSGKVAVVTGAGRGIGRETALLFAREGAKVVVNDLGGGPTGGGQDDSVAAEVVDEIRAAGGEAVAETGSVSAMAGGEAVIAKALASFGGLDILVNNAGILRPGRIDQMSEEDFDRVLAVNLKGYFATIRHGAPHLMRSAGKIVNLSSPSGFGHYGMANYTAAKEGVVGLTRTVARDLGEYGVRCNAVRPITDASAMSTDAVGETLVRTAELGMPPLGNLFMDDKAGGRSPANVAAAIAWLCLPHSKQLNGRELFVTGGHVALVQEPELIRSQFSIDGWSLEQLCDETVSQALTWGQRNPVAHAE